jgi:multidrug efflux pump subunit AcrA (membrane-fusion protein)
MPVRQGDLVEKGQLICRLNDDTLRLQLAGEEASAQALAAALEELENGTRPEELARLKAEYEAAQAIAVKWDFELKRVQALYDSQQAGAKEFQDALGDQLSAHNMMLAAKAAYDLGLAGPRKEVVAQARYSLAAQKAEVERLRTDLAKTRIVAPYKGHIVARNTEVGNWISVGGSVVEMVDLSAVLVRVNTPEKAIPFATSGSPASVHIDALGRSFSGAVKHVIAQADITARTFPIEVEVANPDYAMKSGMFARATIVTGPEMETVAVPKDAISRQMGATFLAMVVPGQGGQLMAIPTPVTVGLDIGDWVAITSGNVPPGADVVIRGNEMISLMMAPSPVQMVTGAGEPAPGPDNPAPSQPGHATPEQSTQHPASHG